MIHAVKKRSSLNFKGILTNQLSVVQKQYVYRRCRHLSLRIKRDIRNCEKFVFFRKYLQKLVLKRYCNFFSVSIKQILGCLQFSQQSPQISPLLPTEKTVTKDPFIEFDLTMVKLRIIPQVFFLLRFFCLPTNQRLMEMRRRLIIGISAFYFNVYSPLPIRNHTSSDMMMSSDEIS